MKGRIIDATKGLILFCLAFLVTIAVVAMKRKGIEIEPIVGLAAAGDIAFFSVGGIYFLT